MILSANDPTSIALCADTVRRGELIGLPTETVYGLAANADSDAAVAKIFVAKGRPASHPLIVHVSAQDGGMSGVAHFCSRVPPFAQQLMSAFWPGPLTLILPRRAAVAVAASGGQASVGLRCPSQPAAQAVLAALRRPLAGQAEVWGLAAPSANRFGRISPTLAAHVASELGPALLVLDAGPCALGIESTIIDCTRGEPVLLRPGSVTRLQLEQACGRKVLSNQSLQALQPPGTPCNTDAPRAPGTLESHYAPTAKLVLMDARTLQSAIDRLQGSRTNDFVNATDGPGVGDTPQLAVYARTPLKAAQQNILLHAMPSTAEAAAHTLFAALRAFDDAKVAQIWVETPPDEPEWEGVLDRLRRAAA